MWTLDGNVRGYRHHGCQGRLSEPGTLWKHPAGRRAAPMKLPPVDYEAPETVSGALELLAEHLDEASVLAGGQSLIPLLALRLARPAVVVGINGIKGLSGGSAADGRGGIGARTREDGRR